MGDVRKVDDEAFKDAVMALCDGMTPGFFFKGLLPVGTSLEIVRLHRVRHNALKVVQSTKRKK